jgi:hypothetical protein
VVIITGNRHIYDNFKAGTAQPELPEGEVAEEIMLTFNEEDRDIVHMFKMHVTAIDQYIRLLEQARAGTKIHIPTAEERSKIQ